MKKLLPLLIYLLIATTACNKLEDNTFVLKGTTDLPDGKRIFRIVPNANGQPITVDTTEVRNGRFSLNGEIDQIDVNFLFIEGQQANAAFILEQGFIDVTLYKDSLNKAKIGGTPSNLDLQNYRKETSALATDLNTIAEEIREANTLGDNLLAQDLQQQYISAQNSLNAYEKQLITDHTDSYVSVLILERFLTQKAIPTSEAKTIFNTYSNRIRSSKSGLKISNIINAPVNPTAIGELAPLFEGPTPNGGQIALESFRGKVTIVDFWASWCRPCRIENPNLVRLYKRMHSKGLEIIGVSLDRNKASWERAISDDGLNWNHVSNLKYWADPIAQLYQVRGIPAAFVLDQNGRIVAKNLRGAQLDAKIEELLGK